MRKRTEKRKMKMINYVPPFVFILIGISMLIFGILSKNISESEAEKIMQVYASNNANQPSDYMASKKALIDEYNNTLKEADYDKLDEVIGYIEIPAIDIKYPIYRYETEENLNKGIAHVSGTHLPSKKKGTHCMLLGHTGEYSNELFTHLDRLETGEGIYITILDDTLYYEVSEIKVVLPEEVTCKAKKGESLITLVTCTPYGANTHRLLVTCKLKGET